VLTHPPIKQENGDTVTESVVEQKYAAGGGTRATEFFGFSFVKGFEAEMVPGTWTQRVYIDGEVVASMPFVVLPK
jgi:hypothetical protein